MSPEDKERLKKYKPNYGLTEEDIFGKPKTKKTTVVYMDEDDNVVTDRKDARKAAIVEEDELGRMIEETFGYFGDPSEAENKKSR